MVADLVARVAKAEDRENDTDLPSKRATRSTQENPVIKDLTSKTEDIVNRLQEVETIVE